MRNRSIHFALSLSVALAAGCATTNVKVAKVTPLSSPDGIRYSLPQPFLLVTPNPSGDGGFEAKVVYLPDESQTYAIDANTRRGKYTLDVSVAEGLLSKIAWKREDASVTAEAIRASGEVTKAELARSQDQQKKEDEKAEAERKEARTKLQSLEDELKKKQLDVQLAEAEVAAAQAAFDEASATSDRSALQAALRASQLKLAQERLRAAAAQSAVDAAQTRVSTLAGAMNDPSTGGVAKPSVAARERARFWGPVLYRIIDDPKAGTVRLVAVRWDGGLAQLPLETAAPPKPTPVPAAGPQLTNTAPIALTFPAGANEFELQLKFDKALLAVDTNQSLLFPTDPPGPVVPKALNLSLKSDDSTVVIVKLLRVPAGSYDLQLRFSYGDNKTSGSVAVPLRVALQ
jgi:hypothetical protein